MAGDRINGPAGIGPEPEPESAAATLAHAAGALEDVRRHLEAASSAASTALVWVRLQQARLNQEGNR